MKGSLVIGMAAGTLLGAASALALSGDLNANGLNKISRRVTRGAKQMGMDM